MNKRHSEIPKSVATLIGKQDTVVKRTVTPGTYFHIGVENNLMKIVDVIKTDNIKEIILDIGIDGLPVFKSSNRGLWPILGRIVNMSQINVFLIGCYVGEKKPNDVDLYLHDLIYDIKNINENGFFVDGCKTKVSIRSFVCDTPARSYVCGIKGHNAINGCSKCDQKGVRIANVTTFSTSVGKLRTDSDFKFRRDKDFHSTKYLNTEMSLETIGINMISQFPIDIMHLIDLGVAKKMILRLITSKSIERLSEQKKQEMSSFMISLYPFIPREFSRKPRSFEDVKKWKAVEFRQFILYTGLIVLKKFTSEQFFEHFLLLSCSYRILVSNNISQGDIRRAHVMLKQFVEQFSYFYGESSVTFNIHNLLHLKDIALQFGNLSNITAYPFENAMTSLKRAIKKPQHIEQQMFNVFNKINLVKKTVHKGVKRNSEGNIISYASHEAYFSTKFQESFCITSRGNPVQIVEFLDDNTFEGNIIVSPKDMFSNPMKSQEIGIFLVDLKFCKKSTFAMEEICYKLVPLPFGNEYLLISFLHCS